MIHSEGVIAYTRTVKGCTLALMTIVAVGCGDTTMVSPPEAFGEQGQIQVEVRSLFGPDEDGDQRPDGRLDEIVIWASNGPWLLTERVSYQGSGGAETFRSRNLNPGELAAEYGSFVRQLSENPGLRLFDGTVPQELEPDCGQSGLPSTQVVVTIRDDLTDETARWVRCAEGTLLPANAMDPRNLIGPGTAAPDAGAARVITAAQLTKSFTLGEAFASTYRGTHPYSALEQGESSPARRETPLAFVSEDSSAPGAFLEFWEDHAGAEADLPNVDWASEIVLLVVVGQRGEAGEEVRARRVLPLGGGSGTRVEVTERVPGDFCSPAAKEIYPYQILLLPKEGVFLPIEFTEPQVERIPCGA